MDANRLNGLGSRAWTLLVASLLWLGGSAALAQCPAGTDVDGDGYGITGSPLCMNGPDIDCVDLDPTVYPGAVEVCDGIEQNCDGLVDNAGAPGLTVTMAGLAWTAVPGAVGYDVVMGDPAVLRGTLGAFAAATLACVIDSTPALGVAAPYVAGAGDFYYLVRAAPSVCAGFADGTYDSETASQRGSRTGETIASGLDCLLP